MKKEINNNLNEISKYTMIVDDFIMKNFAWSLIQYNTAFPVVR